MLPEHIILDHLTEGLTTIDELFHDFKSKYRDKGDTWIRSFLQATLAQLYETNLIDVYLAEVVSDREIKLGKSEAGKALSDENLLTSTSESHYLLLVATAEGEEFYYENPEFRAAFE